MQRNGQDAKAVLSKSSVVRSSYRRCRIDGTCLLETGMLLGYEAVLPGEALLA